MNAPLVVALPGNAAFAQGLAGALGAPLGVLETRRFPDQETYLRYGVELVGRSVVLACTLDRPDGKFLPLAFAAGAARELGATCVGLVCPYLPYLRQDRRFRDGEAVTSRHFAALLSASVDWLVTVDPHLHRYPALDAVYTIPARSVAAAPALAEWIRREVPRPLLIGPDAESAQWVEAVATSAGAPHVVLKKQRRSDREVRITLPDLTPWRGHTPVLVDDIAASAGTLIAALRALHGAGMAPAVCVVVHGIFAGPAYAELQATGATRVVSSNTVVHPSNVINVTPALADAVRTLLASMP